MTPRISAADARQVTIAIAEVFNKGKIPASAPAQYRQALQDLCDARVDRTLERKSRFDRAMKVLQPALDAAEPGIIRATKVEMYLANLEMLAKRGPFPLPTCEMHEFYEHSYVAKGGETVAEVAKKFGYANPGPLCYGGYDYPGNMRLAPGDRITVPFHPATLRNLVKVSQDLIKAALESLKRFIETQHMAKKELEHHLLIIDAIAIVASLGVSAGLSGAKLAAETTEKGTLAAAWAAGKHEVVHAVKFEAGKTSAELVGLAVEHANKRSEAAKLGGLFIRHTIGILHPSYWTPLLTRLFTGEGKGDTFDAWFWGPEGVAEKRIESFARESRRYIFELEQKILTMNSQLASPRYVHQW